MRRHQNREDQIMVQQAILNSKKEENAKKGPSHDFKALFVEGAMPGSKPIQPPMCSPTNSELKKSRDGANQLLGKDQFSSYLKAENANKGHSTQRQKPDTRSPEKIGEGGPRDEQMLNGQIENQQEL
mmetsp:Transcript_13302/g.22594  ORF Transcript_13302/g.22594 Transcript_13302/m.22594 type:complete len:127 (-) Transcript_13302:410-790(-)